MDVPKSTTQAYSPQGDGIGSKDAVFSRVAPGIANSGNLAHKWENSGDHSNGIEPPSGLKGD
jgi:hypothetical protein